MSGRSDSVYESIRQVCSQHRNSRAKQFEGNISERNPPNDTTKVLAKIKHIFVSKQNAINVIARISFSINGIVKFSKRNVRKVTDHLQKKNVLRMCLDFCFIVVILFINKLFQNVVYIL